MALDLFSSNPFTLTLSIKIIMLPQRSQLVFAANIPNSKFQVFIFNRFNIETFRIIEEKKKKEGNVKLKT